MSHWSVYSNATVKLITGAVSSMAADTAIGRAEAIRRSILALIDPAKPTRRTRILGAVHCGRRRDRIRKGRWYKADCAPRATHA